MIRGILFGLGLVSATVPAFSVHAETLRTLQIIVSKDSQSLTVYDGDEVVKTTRVSTGKVGHETPTGIFSILEKRKYHESNIYSNAPMPFMQRLTWSGIALHEGKVPNYPASHGCIRLPSGVAKDLYDMTMRGVHVIISDERVVPVRIEHPVLFTPLSTSPSEPLLSDVDLRPTVKAEGQGPAEGQTGEMTVAIASATSAPEANKPDPLTTGSLQPIIEGPPVRILIQRRTQRETMMDIQTLLGSLGYNAGQADGIAGSLTRSAISSFKQDHGISSSGSLISHDFVTELYKAAAKPLPSNGQIMVRRNFETHFEAPVLIKNPEVALGTHFYSARRARSNSGAFEWFALTLQNEMTPEELKQYGIVELSPDATPTTAATALDRIDISSDIRRQIESLLSDGTSLTITDQGLGPETGKGTDFVTLTRTRLKTAETTATSIKPVRAFRSSQKESAYKGIGLY